MPIVDRVFKALALEYLSTIVATGNGNFPTALDVLAKMAHIMHGLDGINVEGGCGRISSGGLIMEMSLFLAKCSVMRDIPPILRFWGGSNRPIATTTAATDRCGASCRWLFSSSC